jgi:hypothetical protein
MAGFAPGNSVTYGSNRRQMATIAYKWQQTLFPERSFQIMAMWLMGEASGFLLPV